ncbi:hypothetical protein QBC42DRAFT_282584 [Cladorrhinum samala]|uniref:Uncharacterized protein n=1 Tax=Cladorrhinum samala TaxID=585594 RepID=A0AAV9I1X5_9PEZI|nr:hypothetical protein QBC42DRAFT_282584 [Cladorrhinum samala]
MPPYPKLPGQGGATVKNLSTHFVSFLLKRSPSGPDNRDDQDTGIFHNNPFLDDDEGFDLSPGAITGIAAGIVVAFILAIWFCFYRKRGRRRQRKRGKHVDIALKEHPSWSQSLPDTPAAPAQGGRRRENDAPPPPYEAAHLGSRQDGVVHRWDSRTGNRNRANGEVEATVVDGISPGVPTKHTGLRIGD